MELTYKFNEKEIPLLYLTVKLNEDKIIPDLYINSTDRHQYLHFTSSHLNHTQRSTVSNQGLPVKRIYSEKEEDFLKHMMEMKLWFLKWGYSEKIVHQELRKVKFSKSS